MAGGCLLAAPSRGLFPVGMLRESKPCGVSSSYEDTGPIGSGLYLASSVSYRMLPLPMVFKESFPIMRFSGWVIGLDRAFYVSVVTDSRC